MEQGEERAIDQEHQSKKRPSVSSMMCERLHIMYSTVQYSTVQYSTVQYSTVQYSTVQYSTVQYSIVSYLGVQVPHTYGPVGGARQKH